MELKAKKSVKIATAADNGRERGGRTFGQSAQQQSMASREDIFNTPAAAVLTAVDEDDEDGEEAECPRSFEYDTDAEDE
jgi:26S proteasome regulatory subunit N2